MFGKRQLGFLLLTCVCVLCAAKTDGQEQNTKLTVHWDKTIRVSQTTPTLQVVVNPPLRRGTPVHDNAFRALQDLGRTMCAMCRGCLIRDWEWPNWSRPKTDETSWDFSVIDPMTIDFLEATKGHSVILNFSTIPQWMYKTDKPVAYPDDPNQVFWEYEKGTELRDGSMKEVADYYGRLFAWYTKGGFTDEFGKRHESGYHFSIPYWEVLNEPEFEHQTTPETYTKIYDAVVESILAVEPKTKFVGMALAAPSENPRYFEYFLDHKNHKAGIPLDFISYHFYAVPTADQTPQIQQVTFFTQAEGFLKRGAVHRAGAQAPFAGNSHYG